MQHRQTLLHKHAESANFVRGFCLHFLFQKGLFVVSDQEKVPKSGVLTFSTAHVSVKVQCDAHMQSSF